MASADNKLLVIGLRTGRLGNRLVLFANVIAFAAEHGHRVVNPAFHSYAHLFENTRRDIYCHYPVARRRSVWDRIPGAASAIRKIRILYQLTRLASQSNDRFPLLGSRVLTLREVPRQTIQLDAPEVLSRMAASRIVFVHGWRIRARESVRCQAEAVRAHLRPVAEFEQAADRAVDALRRQADVIVGVHVRHGDYRTWRGGRYFFPASRYADWMRALAAQFPGQKVAFLVCSDERRSAEEFPGLTVGLGAGSFLGDLTALSKCDYLFGPVSTFTQWASFYGDTPVFYLRDGGVRIERDRFAVADLDEIP